jgi:Ca2+-binding EF-hand superfamily protein
MVRFCEQVVIRSILAILVAAAFAGCWRPSPPSAPAAAVKPASIKQAVSESASTPSPVPGELEPTPAIEEKSDAAVATEPDPSAGVAGATEPPREFSTERIVLLAPQNPLIIDLMLTIDGEPHVRALEKLVDHVLKIGDTDGDGRTMWKELCASSKIKYGQYGNLAVDNENSEKQIIDRYDTARDGVVGREELPRFLTRNAGSSRPFSIRGSFDYRDRNRRAAPTWQVLDADEDGAISAEERRLAGSLLASRDNDDDEIVNAADLNPRLQTPDQEMMADRRRRGPTAAYLLGPHADWSGLQLALEQEYGGGRFLREDSFPLTPELFVQLDANKDGRIRRDEIRGLNDVPAQVVIAVEFGNEGSKVGGPTSESNEQTPAEEAGNENSTAAKPSGPRLKLVSIVPALAGESAATIEQPGRLMFAAGGILLSVYTNDTVASEDFSARVKQALDMFDQNKDGYLVKEELPETLQGQFGRFEAVDADEDGKAYSHEIEAFLTQQQAGLRAQIHARAGDQDDALFSALDSDRDVRLDSREIEAAGQRLAALDRNSDGNITPDELPEVLVLGLARGSLENADALFVPPPVITRRTDDKAPRWFTAMDANRDGVISQREFLGPPEKFGELDRDGNGLLELGEAEAKR